MAARAARSAEGHAVDQPLPPAAGAGLLTADARTARGRPAAGAPSHARAASSSARSITSPCWYSQASRAPSAARWRSPPPPSPRRCARRSPRVSASSPSPVMAETATPPGRAGTCPTPPSRSALFSTSMVRSGQAASSVPSATMSSSTAITSARCARGVRMRGVAHVQDHVGLGHLLQRGAEGGHQFVRQLADEADGVGQDHPPPGRQPQPAHGRDRAWRTTGRARPPRRRSAR